MTAGAEKTEKTLVVWRFTDGKPGHESQTLGLISAIEEYHKIERYDFRAGSWKPALLDTLFSSFQAPDGVPRPDLILGAGHATHWPLLAAKRAYGGKTIVLMKPSLPLCLFDHCVIPKHDNPPKRKNVITTEGVLNPVRPARNASGKKGLILIGGESAHYVWDDARIRSQLDVILEQDRGMSWTLTTSRRTPQSTIQMLMERSDESLMIVPHSETPQGWVSKQLQVCGEVWVTPDSMSMLYEAMSASSRVGVFQLNAKRADSRVVRALHGLLERFRLAVVEEGRVARPDRVVQPLSEASRVAPLLLSEVGCSGSFGSG
jgi:mitochondrial fission protein ELM1